MGYYPYDTIENVAIAAFDDGAPVPVKQLELAITSVQTGTGDPAPDNVRPIYGFTKAEISVISINQWDEEWEHGSYNLSTGEATSYLNNIRSVNAIPVIAGRRYYMVTPFSTYVLFYTKNGDFLGNNYVIDLPIGGGYFTIPNGANLARFTCGAQGADYGNNISFNYPAIKKYYKYFSEVTTVNFPAAAGTVYGDTLKYTGDGKYLLTVGKVHNTFTTFGTFAQGASFAYGSFDLTGAPSTGGAYKDDVITSALKVNVDPAAYSCRRIDAKLYCFFPLGTTQEEAEALIDGMDTVYPLATAQTYEITAEAVETLYKNNVIFANTGNIIKLEYRLNQLDYYRRLEMYNFGYIMMDGGGIDLSSSDPQTITGAWARTVEAIKTGKPIFAYNTKYGTGKNLTPVPCFAWYINSTTAVIVGATLHIQVTSDDTCVVQDVAPSVNRALTMGIDALAEKAVDVDELKTAKAKAKK